MGTTLRPKFQNQKMHRGKTEFLRFFLKLKLHESYKSLEKILIPIFFFPGNSGKHYPGLWHTYAISNAPWLPGPLLAFPAVLWLLSMLDCCSQLLTLILCDRPSIFDAVIFCHVFFSPLCLTHHSQSQGLNFSLRFYQQGFKVWLQRKLRSDEADASLKLLTQTKAYIRVKRLSHTQPNDAFSKHWNG